MVSEYDAVIAHFCAKRAAAVVRDCYLDIVNMLIIYNVGLFVVHF